jgi:hypothetical protein
MSTHTNIPEHNRKFDFKVPEGYFDSLTQRIQDRLNDSVAVAESKDDAMFPIAEDNNFEVPVGYFDELENSVVKRASSQDTSRNVIVKKLVGWTVAASVVLAAFFLLPEQTSMAASYSFETALAQSDLEMEEFISVLSNDELEGLFIDAVNTIEIAELAIVQEEETIEVSQENISEEIKPTIIDEALMNEELDEASEYLFE